VKSTSRQQKTRQGERKAGRNAYLGRGESQYFLVSFPLRDEEAVGAVDKDAGQVGLPRAEVLPADSDPGEYIEVCTYKSAL
jgi:hypothetical protein